MHFKIKNFQDFRKIIPYIKLLGGSGTAPPSKTHVSEAKGMSIHTKWDQ